MAGGWYVHFIYWPIYWCRWTNYPFALAKTHINLFEMRSVVADGPAVEPHPWCLAEVKTWSVRASRPSAYIILLQPLVVNKCTCRFVFKACLCQNDHKKTHGYGLWHMIASPNQHVACTWTDSNKGCRNYRASALSHLCNTRQGFLHLPERNQMNRKTDLTVKSRGCLCRWSTKIYREWWTFQPLQSPEDPGDTVPHLCSVVPCN